MAQPPEPHRILVRPDGSAIVVRTPLGRSARFRSLDDAVRWHEGQHAVALPVLVAGGIAAVAKALLPEDLFLQAFVLVLAGGTIASLVVWQRTKRALPEPTWLSWSESVALDDRAHPLSAVARDLGVSLACGALLALVSVLIADAPYRLERLGALEQIAAALFVLALLVGVLFGIWSAVMRLRFHLSR